MAFDAVTLTGEHVRLEPLTRDRVDELWPAANEPELWAYMTFHVALRDDLARWVDGRVRAAEAGTALVFLQRDLATGEAAGSTSLFDIELAHKRLEIGHTWLGKAYRRTPINTEAKRLLLEHAFEVMGVNRVQFKTDRRNERSKAAIARLGATLEGTLRQHVVLPDGFVRDSVVYGIVRDEWPAVRRRLDALLKASPASGPEA